LYEDRARWQSAVEKGVSSVFPGIVKVVVTAGGGGCPPDEGLAGLIKGMKDIKADELLLERAEGKLLVVRHGYGELAAAVYYGDDTSPADLSRLIQLIFARREPRPCDKASMPAAEVEKLTRRWKRRIGLVFGPEFASMLVESALKGKDKSAMTIEELEGARAVVSSALGDCLRLDKVNK
jgi:hypothetical protein